MARRRRKTVTRYVRSARRGYRRRGGFKAPLKKMAPGFLSGVIQSFVPNDALGGFADPAVPAVVGYLMKDDTMMSLGAYQLGIRASQKFGAGSGSLGWGQVS